ncbi:MAG: isocitrate/isopropylmalate dehydrogenase family protein [Candidatus Sumerlaeota bacterium]|nr:isocitrate/isopropylmalate dehydrogenase family protein [Candidatus Sumerlaeota bacterium]
MTHDVCLIAGDGIGPEITHAAQRVLAAAGAKINWIPLHAGAEAIERYGSVAPNETLDAVRRHKVALKGPTTTPIGTGHTSANVQLRQKLHLYAAVRPVRSIAGIKTRYDNVEIVVIRENTEGLYSGIENEIVPGVMQTLKIATRTGCERIARFGFHYAQERKRRKVTVFHKANIMKKTDGLFLECCRRIHAEIAAEIEYEELIIDNACMQLVRDPSRFDVLLMENFYGDIVSDLCAGMVGGLGVAPGANFGDECAVFEAVHGSAPDIAGRGIANPLSIIMSGVMMLNHLGEHACAERIKAAYDGALSGGRPEERTLDIGGTATTEQFADALIRRME